MEIEKRLSANEVNALVGTSALGMGFDKPNLGFVLHFQAHAYDGWRRRWVYGSSVAGAELLRQAGERLRDAYDVGQ